MPHQCVRCNKLYPDGSKELLKGCPSCSGKFFFFIKPEIINKTEELISNLTEEDKSEIEKDIKYIIGDKFDEDVPVFLDVESIKILKPGQYEIDVVKLLKNKMLVYKLEDGKYIIDLDSTFKNREEE